MAKQYTQMRDVDFAVLSKRISEIATEYESLAKKMGEHSIEDVQIRGVGSLEYFLERIETTLHHSQAAVQKAVTSARFGALGQTIELERISETDSAVDAAIEARDERRKKAAKKPVTKKKAARKTKKNSN